MGKLRMLIVVGVAAVGQLAVVALASARWPAYWELIAGEETPMTWLQTVVLAVIGVVCVQVAAVLHLLRRPRRWLWLSLAAVFAAFALDERFMGHEGLRDQVLAPRGVVLPFLPWVAPGDYVLLLVAVAGLVALPLLWRALAGERAARTALLIAMAFALVAVGKDSIAPASFTVESWQVWQTLEEVFELASMLSLLASFSLYLLWLVSPLPQIVEVLQQPGVADVVGQTERRPDRVAGQPRPDIAVAAGATDGGRSEDER